MKKVTLKFPITKGGEEFPLSVLKVEGNTTKAFWDADCKDPVSDNEKFVLIEVEIPEELTRIDTGKPAIAVPVDDIAIDWIVDGTHVVNLCKVTIILDDREYVVPVKNEVIDQDNWTKYILENYTLCLKTWAIVVYHFEEESIGFLHWDRRLAKSVLN